MRSMHRFRRRARRWCPRLVGPYLAGTAALPGLGGALGAGTPTPTATTFACHPPGSARYRYVVDLALESVS